MNKTVPWNVKGADAREAARETARRQGKSLGEWLHGVIADRASLLGVEETDMATQDRVEAVTSRLEQMTGRAPSFERRPHDDRADERSRARLNPLPPDTEEPDESSRRTLRRDRAEPRHTRAAALPVDETELLLEEAMDMMERRALRAERRTDAALASFAKLLEKDEAHRERERTSVNVLSQKLTAIESRLGEHDTSPIKGTLARLEARLETIGRRATAEAAVMQGVAPTDRQMEQAPDSGEPIRRLEEKLNAVLEAVSTRPASLVASVSPIAIAASHEVPPRQRRLGAAISEITNRQRVLDESRESSFDASSPYQDRRPNAARQDPSAPSPQQRPTSQGLTSSAVRPADRKPEQRGATSAADQASERSIDIMEALAAFEKRFKPEKAGGAASLETIVRDLGDKMDAVQTPGAGAPAITALQDQIGVLAARFEGPGSGSASLSDLERSMRDLFAHLEDTRASVETIAATAAREASRLATKQDRDDDALDRQRDLAALRALQDEADARTKSTLEAVHDTLDKVIHRLAAVESDLAEVRPRPKVTPAEAEHLPIEPIESGANTTPDVGVIVQPSPMISLGGLDPLSDPMFAAPSGEFAKTTTPVTADRLTDLDEEAGPADFIAAARRAAKAAQTDASVVAMKRSTSGSSAEARAGLAVKSRDYVASHKRPVLLSLAAIFVIIGAMAIMHRRNPGDIASEVAGYSAPAKIVRAQVPPTPTIKMATSAPLGAMTPSELPRSGPPLVKPIPGSDPIQTGSIASLPSFAAHAPSAPSTPVAPPSSLVALADTGNAAANYELGAFYADGKTAPRDFKLAAKYYGKAADQGLAPAQYRLASLYEKGLGVTQDKLKAKSLYLKAAEAGNPRAMHNLAVLLADGNGKPDYEAAANWFGKAARYGVHDSQFNLAILFARGLGVPQSLVQSYQWFAVAADQHDADAAAKRDEVASKLNASDLAVAKALAASFRPRVADAVATDVAPSTGGRDGASLSSPLNSARSKISSL